VRTQLALQRLFGIRLDLRGAENLPREGGIIAAKHQSMWETFALVAFVRFPAFVYKKELGHILLFGSYLRKLRQIPVDRSAGSQAVKTMGDAARAAVDEGRQVLIFPEGTRKRPGSAPAYKFGIAKLYEATGRPVTPIALNSGLFWSNFFWNGHPGTIIVQVLPPIAPGLDRDTFFAEVQAVIERASDRLLLETAHGPNPPPLSPEAAARVKALEAAVQTPAG
jgi:1-acyl-sn-glycerol-3-phosphate acyltransferase